MMKPTRRWKIAIVASFLALMTTEYSSARTIVEFAEGNDKGNGADNSSTAGAVSWFSGSRAVRYCLSVALDFPVDPGALARKTEAVINQWVEMIKNTEYEYYSVRGPMDHLALSYRQMAKCDGSEDLKFYFGGTNDEIEKAKAKYSNPVAVAEQTFLDKSKAWSKGFVWLAPHGSVPTGYGGAEVFPDWTKDYQVHAFLLHEVGHVFGCNHMGGTIMRKNLSWFVSDTFWTTRLGTDYLYKINQQRLVFEPVADEYLFPGILGYHYKDSGRFTSAEEVFVILTGKKPKGKLQARFRYRHDYLAPSIAELTVEDGAGIAGVFPVRLNEMGTEARIIDDARAGGFVISYATSDGDFFAADADNDNGKVITGQIKTKPGKTLMLTIQVNMVNVHNMVSNNGPVTIGFLDTKANKWKSLFQANLIHSKY